jgi:hypothetical protein
MLCAAICTIAVALPGGVRAQTNANDIESIRQETEQLKNRVRELERRLEAAEAAAAARDAPAVAGTAPVAATAPGPAWSPSQPITLLGAGTNYLNLSLDVLTDVGTSTESDVGKLQLGGHDPNQRGFSLPNLELAFDGAVDPYFKAFANLVFFLDADGESQFEVEEAYGLTTSLPWNLQVKAGQFFAEFGRQNPTHPHTWAFVDLPLVLGRLFGEDGLRNPGVRLSWLAPTPFYTELLLGVFNGKGETASSFRNDEGTFGRTPSDADLHDFGDLLYVPRLTSSFDLSDTQTLVVGASGAFGANAAGSDTSTQIYGLDLYWKWRPVSAQRGFPFLSWQTEALLRRYEADADATVAPALPAESFDDYGFYSQLLWGFRTGWVAGLRGEWVGADSAAFDQVDPAERADRTRVSPNVTWYPTEFSKLRLQYNYDHGDEIGDEHSLWLQLELLLGAHGAHKF